MQAFSALALEVHPCVASGTAQEPDAAASAVDDGEGQTQDR
jgi:hypothetical protein